MDDVLVIGGGVIGLSLALDLAKHGVAIQVVDQGEPGREASWAGAGILPAAVRTAGQHAFEQLCGLACELHKQWAAELFEHTGIDTGYRRCGGLHLARSPGEAAALTGWAGMLREEGVEVEQLSVADAGEMESGLATRSVTAVFHVPGEAQLRNPWHMRALLEACREAGVKITPNFAADEFVSKQGELFEVSSLVGSLRARSYCFTGGAWTGNMLSRLGIATGILPVRGQMALFKCDKPPLTRIINEGSRYLVPREDGCVLAGSTEEEVGFDKRTTEEAIADLTDFARALVPSLRDAPIERTWAGLRPGSFDGLPYLGRLPGLKNAYVAAGHFRSGLFLSTATAVVMSQLIRGQQTQIDLLPFRVGR